MNEYRGIGVVAPGAPPNLYTIAQLWNPAANRRVTVVEATAWNNTTGTQTDKFELARSTARGATPGSTITPAAQDSNDNSVAPPSAAVIEIGPFGTEPTLASPRLMSCGIWLALTGVVQPSGFLYPIPRGIVVPPGTGLCIVADNGESMDMYQASITFLD